MSFKHVVALGAALGGLGWIPQGVAETNCPSGAPASAAGICPVFVPGDPSCADAVEICGVSKEGQVVVSPPKSFRTGPFQIEVTTMGYAIDVKDVSPPSQQNGTRGYEIAIVKRDGANIYCGTSVLHDIVTAPGSRSARTGSHRWSKLTICWGRSPCGLDETRVENACSQYNDPYTRRADFLQAYEIGPIEQEINLCGCAPAVAQFCDPRQPILDQQEDPRFVACNPNNAPLKAAEAESVATEGTDTCIWMTIGGRRLRVDRDGTDPRC
jgi:hypothetical protein